MGNSQLLTPKSAQKLHVLVFEVDKHLFAFNILDLVAITRLLEITPVAQTADFFAGLINLRGRLTPVINLRLLFQLPPQPVDQRTRLITVKGAGSPLAFVVDQLQGFSYLETENLEEPPDILFNQFIKTVYKAHEKLIIILDTRKIIDAEEIKKVILTRGCPKLMLSEEEPND
ncbi:chemotaxis protein CheW [Deltaproteobacteria bacterium TL4]